MITPKEPNVSGSIPGYLLPEYTAYWRQWYGRREAARAAADAKEADR
jgi:hypothetical protein